MRFSNETCNDILPWESPQLSQSGFNSFMPPLAGTFLYPRLRCVQSHFPKITTYFFNPKTFVNNGIDYCQFQKHIIHAKDISDRYIGESAKMQYFVSPEGARNTSVKRQEAGRCRDVAMENNEFAGFCYIEVWGHGKYVAHSGLIVSPAIMEEKDWPNKSRKGYSICLKGKFPNAKIFGITTGKAVMRINYELGYQPVVFSELTDRL